MIELKATALEASGEDWGVRVQRITGRPDDACPWYWSAWTKAGGGHIEWEGESPTREAAEQNAVGALDRLQGMLKEPGLAAFGIDHAR